MSKTFARSSLCALSMTIMTAHAAEPPTNLENPEGRLDNAIRKRDRLRGEC